MREIFHYHLLSIFISKSLIHQIYDWILVSKIKRINLKSADFDPNALTMTTPHLSLNTDQYWVQPHPACRNIFR